MARVGAAIIVLLLSVSSYQVSSVCLVCLSCLSSSSLLLFLLFPGIINLSNPHFLVALSCLALPCRAARETNAPLSPCNNKRAFCVQVTWLPDVETFCKKITIIITIIVVRLGRSKQQQQLKGALSRSGVVSYLVPIERTKRFIIDSRRPSKGGWLT